MALKATNRICFWTDDVYYSRRYCDELSEEN